MICRKIFVSALFVFSLGGCVHENVDQTYSNEKQSIVLLSYQNKEGYGTGFFVESDTRGFCSVLTTAHSVGLKQELNLWITDNQKPSRIKIDHVSSQRIGNLDLAIIKFNTSDRGGCLYQPLKLSEKPLNNSTPIAVVGYVPTEPPTLQVSSGNVSRLEGSSPEGYTVTQTAKTLPGMSGSPILNDFGEVVAVHGRGNSSTYGLSIPIKEYFHYLEEQKNIQDLLFSGDFDVQAGEYTFAERHYNEIIKRSSNHPEALVGLGRAYQKMRRYSEALVEFNHALQVSPNHAKAFAWRGETYQQIERYQEAIQDFNNAIELSPKYTEAITLRGETYRQMGRYQEAIQDFNNAFNENLTHDDKKYILSRRGETHRQMGRNQEALEDFNLALRPNSWWNNVFEAEKDYEDIQIITRRGATYLQMKDYEKSLKDLNYAIQLQLQFSFKDEWAIAWRGELRRENGEFEAAESDFSKALEINPNNAWVVGRRGEAYRQIGIFGTALNDFNRALLLKPNDNFARENKKALKTQLEQLLKQVEQQNTE